MDNILLNQGLFYNRSVEGVLTKNRPFRRPQPRSAGEDVYRMLPIPPDKAAKLGKFCITDFSAGEFYES